MLRESGLRKQGVIKGEPGALRGCVDGEGEHVERVC